LYVLAIHQVKQIKNFQTKAWYQFNLDMIITIVYSTMYKLGTLGQKRYFFEIK
jgi:hypothetical protein